MSNNPPVEPEVRNPVVVYLMTSTEEETWLALEAAGLASREYDPDDPDNQPPTDPMEAENFVASGAFTWVFDESQGANDMFGTIYVKTGETIPGEDGPVAVIEPLDNNFYTNLALFNDQFDTSSLPVVTPSPTTPYQKFAGQDQWQD